MGCRDCSRCTESFVMSFLMIPLRLLVWLLTCWNIRLFQRFCPQCGHVMGKHARLTGGRFAD